MTVDIFQKTGEESDEEESKDDPFHIARSFGFCECGLRRMPWPYVVKLLLTFVDKNIQAFNVQVYKGKLS